VTLFSLARVANNKSQRSYENRKVKFMRLQNVKKTIIAFLVSLCLYLPIALLINFQSEFFENYQQHDAVMIQRSAYAFIRKCILAGEELPKKIGDLREITRPYIDYYNTDAWEKPEKLLFKYKHGRFYCVTFGDSSSAVLTYWHPSPIKPVAEIDENTYLYSRPYFLMYWGRVLTLGVIAILITILVSSRLIRSQKANKPALD